MTCCKFGTLATTGVQNTGPFSRTSKSAVSSDAGGAWEPIKLAVVEVVNRRE